MTPCSLVGGYRPLGATYCHHLQDRSEEVYMREIRPCDMWVPSYPIARWHTPTNTTLCNTFWSPLYPWVERCTNSTAPPPLKQKNLLCPLPGWCPLVNDWLTYKWPMEHCSWPTVQVVIIATEPFKRQVKSNLPSAGIIRSSPYSTR